ncbi:hypothetical protein PUN28_010578 [Cardiocondyla obscurior]|uniref:Uncharacterized protein n=1 Tax=Cardiocondyla obscurior TaxID=286306 RepID=A0AAW2FIL8_9HYME
MDRWCYSPGRCYSTGGPWSFCSHLHSIYLEKKRKKKTNYYYTCLIKKFSKENSRLNLYKKKRNILLKNRQSIIKSKRSTRFE